MRNLIKIKPLLFGLLGLNFLCLLGVAAWNVPFINDRLAWRVDNWRTSIQYALNPPDEAVFVPEQDPLAPAQLRTSTPVPTLTIPPDQPTPTPTITPTPVAASTILNGIRFEWQSFNNCGPANLAMALTFWDWQGDQTVTKAYLRPATDDYNVMPEEMLDFVHTQTNFRALTRAGGDPEMLKRLIAAGFPVIIEEGHDPEDNWWMGHYLLFSGYDDNAQIWIAQDSLIMPDMPVPYASAAGHWIDFNYRFLVIYPPERETEVFAILGPLADERAAYQIALERAQAETQTRAGREQFFAWFNQGSSLVGLQDYTAAASAYDQAFAIYETLSEEDRPWRMLWYQVGPYEAYYYAGRYNDVINLANLTLSWLQKHGLEESYYWRGLAYEAQGNLELAAQDLQKSIQLNPNFVPGQAALQRLGLQ
jgi:hypothetical protein